MPVKNAGKFLNYCVSSILSQSYSNWELIAVNDHSSDNSLEILEAFKKQDKRIKVFTNEGSGIIHALQLAFKHATGQYITRMDADDIMEADKIELMRERLQQKGTGYLCVGLVSYFGESKLGDGYLNYAEWLNNLSASENNFSDIYKECSIPSPCWMIHKDDLIACKHFQPEIYPEDYDLAFRFRKAKLKICTVNKVVHQWRDHESRASRNDEHYADNSFTELKVKHFIDQDYKTEKQLIVWGAGKKAKKIATLLQQNNIPFLWMCNNEKKVGKDIYGVTLYNLSLLSEKKEALVIVAIKSIEEEKEVEEIILHNNQHQYFRFA